jgi:ATP-dependent RNA helicase RhlE
MSERNTQTGFGAFALPEPLQRSVEKMGFTVPTPIQQSAIPVGLSGRDVVGIAQTGTGKTLAFALPIIARGISNRGMSARSGSPLSPDRVRERQEAKGLDVRGLRALILAPTRELALQIEAEFNKVGGPLGITSCVLIGGAPINRQAALLRRGPNVIIATPGRLLDHITQRNVHLDKTDVVVLDEADRMLDMGFLPTIKQILDKLPKERQTMLFSATMPAEITKIAKAYLNDPVRVEVAPQGTPTELVKQELYVVAGPEKGDLLSRLLNENEGTILVFARTRHGARKVARNVRNMGHSAAELHSDRTLAQRKEALEGFKKGQYRVLVATDIAARGIDVKEISLVINFDLPDCSEDYVHRIGRTGRAGHIGAAVTLATPEQGKDVREIERLIGVQLPVVGGDEGAIRRQPGAPSRRPSGARGPKFTPSGRKRGFAHSR